MAKRIITKRIGEILLERGLITFAQLEKAIAQQKAQGGLLGQILIEQGSITEEEVALALTAQYGFPYLPLDNYEIDDGVTKLVPEQVARQFCVIPIDRIGNALTVAMADPSNTQAVEDIELLTKCVVQTFVSTPSAILQAITRYYKSQATNGSPDAQP
jgi:type IV pilus assembly protein PilB